MSGPAASRDTVPKIFLPTKHELNIFVDLWQTPRQYYTIKASTPSSRAWRAVQATTNLNFSAANYSKVGDYEFTITEDSSTDATNYPIDASHNSYKALVQVRYYTDPNTNVPDNTRYVATVMLKDKNGTKVSSNTAEWTSGSERTYIEVVAKTTGNLGETTECFNYTVTIPTGHGVSAGDTFTVSTASTCTNPSTITAGSATTISLKHGDTLLIGNNNDNYQLPIGAEYTITGPTTSNGYTTKMDGSQKTTVTKNTVASDAECDENDETVPCFDKNNHTDIENNKQSDPLTGIVTNFWFYIMLLVAGIVGFFIISRRKRDDEEQQQA